MVIKVYVALISCSQEVKKNQQRAIMILESKKVMYTIIDITDPENEEAKEYMVENAKPKEGAKVPVTPQIFNEADYCGDFDALDMANECDTLGDFLKLSETEKAQVKIGITRIIPTDSNKEQEDIKMSNGVSTSREHSPEKPLVVENQVHEIEQKAQDEPVVTQPAAAPAVVGGNKPAPVEEDEEDSEDETSSDEAKSNADINGVHAASAGNPEEVPQVENGNIEVENETIEVENGNIEVENGNIEDTELKLEGSPAKPRESIVR